jgi:ankyrin repeat protein
LRIYSSNNKDIINYLIDKGIDINAKNKFGQTPLFYAVMYNHSPEIIQHFIDQGANINIKDTEGDTILGLAEARKDIMNIIKSAQIGGKLLINTRVKRKKSYINI